MSIDWSQCPAVESIPGKRSGALVFRGTRTPVSVVFENIQDMSIHELIEEYGVTRDRWKLFCNLPLNLPKRRFHSANAGPLRQRYTTNSRTISDRPPHGSEARARGWHELENGELLNAAEGAGFEVLVTTDKGLGYQQNLSGRRIAIVVLGQGRWSLVRAHVSAVVAAVDAATPGSFAEVEIPYA